MNIWDYIEYDDAQALNDEEFESFRNYLKFLGHRVLDDTGRKNWKYCTHALTLDDDGDLVWLYLDGLSHGSGSRIPLEEVKRMTAFGMVV